MSKIAEIYRNIEASGRDEVFIHLRPQAEVEEDGTHRKGRGEGPAKIAKLLFRVSPRRAARGGP